MSRPTRLRFLRILCIASANLNHTKDGSANLAYAKSCQCLRIRFSKPAASNSGDVFNFNLGHGIQAPPDVLCLARQDDASYGSYGSCTSPRRILITPKPKTARRIPLTPNPANACGYAFPSRRHPAHRMPAFEIGWHARQTDHQSPASEDPRRTECPPSSPPQYCRHRH